MKQLYIETSVWSQLEHDDRPDWRDIAEQFMETLRKGLYEPYISYVVVRELMATPDIHLRDRLVQHVNSINPTILEPDQEIETLTELYMTSAFVNTDTVRIYNDCSHVAVATVNRIHHIVSFNCKHLVNDRRIDGFNAINFHNGYDSVVDITTPHRFVLPETQE